MNNYNLILIASIIIIVLILIYLLSEKSKEKKGGCKSDPDCEEGICHDGKCVQCTFDSDCAGSNICQGYVCVPNEYVCPTVVDSMEVGQPDIVTIGGTVVEGYASPDILGGSRRVHAVVTGLNSFDVSFFESEPGMSEMLISHGGLTSSTVTVVYDGSVTGDETFAGDGFGDIDLTQCSDTIRLLVSNTDQVSDFSIDIYTTPTDFSGTGLISMPITLADTPFDFLFSSLTTLGGSGADFTKVNAIVLTVVSSPSGFDGAYSSLDLVQSVV